MTDLLSRLAEIRELQGREPIPDPTRIEGFGRGAPSPPPLPAGLERGPVDLSQVPENPDDFENEVIPPSPLIPTTATLDDFSQRVQSTLLPKPDLAVVGIDAKHTIAQYLGREVTLNDRESASVKAVILRALQRVVKEQLAEVRALLPKRRRRKVESEHSNVSGPLSGPPPPPSPKRRGRKPRERLDGSLS